jgi:hypothetical protein
LRDVVDVGGIRHEVVVHCRGVELKLLL